jgi:SAM-dependent methyltransferase
MEQAQVSGAMTDAALRKEVLRLAPWHLNVELTPETSTSVSLDAELTPEQTKFQAMYFIDPRESWINLMTSIYPRGLEGRKVLDCACNCGGYSFWMRELGGDGGLAFDVRERWIEQARFLQAHRTKPSDGVRFVVADLYDLPSLTKEFFDISIFKGIFYHLPDPIHGLRLVADRTRELLIVNTEARADLPDGMLAISSESAGHPMSGIYGVNWHPTGPDVVAKLMNSMGFRETRCTFWHKEQLPTSRLEVIGARHASVFEHFDRVRGGG